MAVMVPNLTAGLWTNKSWPQGVWGDLLKYAVSSNNHTRNCKDGPCCEEILKKRRHLFCQTAMFDFLKVIFRDSSIGSCNAGHYMIIKITHLYFKRSACSLHCHLLVISFFCKISMTVTQRKNLCITDCAETTSPL
jgi:hypothetical protein